MADHKTTTQFKVDISQLKAGITEANRQIRLVNSEFKAATAGMDDWSKSADGVTAKLNQLEGTLTVQQNVLSNLERQYELTVNEMGEGSRAAQELQIKINNQRAAIANTERQITNYTNSLNEITQAAEDAADAIEDAGDAAEDNVSAYDRLTREISDQEDELKALQREYSNYVLEGRDASDEARQLAGRIADLSNELDDNRRTLNHAEDAAENLANQTEDAGEAAEKAEKDFSGLNSKLGDLAKKGFAAVGAAAAGVVTAFLGAAESTREYREDIGKLQTAFESAGQPAETATEMYKGFFSVLGEEDRSVEAVNHLAKLTTNQEDLAKWTDICAGVWGTFGDSLPIEGLTEASNETAKTGQLTGVLADALNWAGVSEDEFQASLDACNTEQERATLITETLNGLYAEAAENYKENNKAVMEAQRAQSELTDAMAAVGAVAEPVMTSLKLLGAEMLNGIIPAVEILGSAFNDLINGVDGAGDKVGTAIGDIVNFAIEKITEMLPQVLNAGVSLILSLAQGITQAVPQLLSALLEILPGIIKTLGEMIPQVVSSLISGLYLIINAIIENAPAILTAAVEFFTGLVTALPQIIEQLLSSIDLLVTQLCDTLVEYFPELLAAAMELLGAIIEAIPQIIQSLVTYLPYIVETIIDTFVEMHTMMLDAAIQLFMALVEALPEIITALVEALPELINSILTAVLEAIPELLDAAIEFFMAIIDAVPIIIDELAPVIPDIITTIVEILIDNIPTILAAAVMLFMAIVKAIPKIIVELVKAVPKIVTAILEGLGSLAGSLANLLGEAFDTFVEWGKDLISKGAEVAGDLFDTIVEKIKGLPKEMLSIGKNIVEGLWNGINDMSAWISEKIKGFGDGVLDGIKDFFGIASPSKVLRKEVGRYLPEGLALGISDTAKKAINAAKNMSDGIKSTVSGINDGLSFNNSAGINAGSSIAAGTSNSYNFVQNNYSPKALSRMEIYRQTQNQISLIKGVQNV